MSLSSSESSIASTSSGSDMFTDTERDGEGGATMSISNILDSSTLDDADTSLDLVDMSPMSGGLECILQLRLHISFEENITLYVSPHRVKTFTSQCRMHV